MIFQRSAGVHYQVLFLKKDDTFLILCSKLFEEPMSVDYLKLFAISYYLIVVEMVIVVGFNDHDYIFIF